MTQPRSPLLFLSHAAVDTDAARALAERIEGSADARAHGLRVFFDKRDIAAGRGWQQQLESAIDVDSTAFAVLVGSRGIVNWVESEVRLALDRTRREPDYPLIPIVSDRCGTDFEEALPPFVKLYQAVRNVESDADEFAKLLSAALRSSGGRPPAVVAEPFVGLYSFQSSDAYIFFGREQETDELVERLRRNQLVMVVGDSGSGKSSLVKAGLLPRFRGGALADSTLDGRGGPWHVVETRPRADPFHALADDLADAARALGMPLTEIDVLRARVRSRRPDALRDALIDAAPRGAEVLLCVDQFEELWTQCASDARIDIAHVLARLADPTRPSRVRVVLTMRRDYFNLCRELDELRALIEPAQGKPEPDPVYTLRRITDHGLRRAVAEPLRLAGARETTALERRILADAGDQPAEITLVQVALDETWRRRAEHDGNLLEAYVEIGGVAGALAQLAEDLFRDKLNEHERLAAEPIFLRLVRLGDTGGTTRRVAARHEFDDETWRLVQKFGAADFRRLMAISGASGVETVELCHEALVTQWPRYQSWLQAAAHDKRRHDRLIEATRRWLAADRVEDCLLSGRDLDDGLAVGKVRPHWVCPTEDQLLAASAARREESLKRERHLADQEQASARRRLRTLRITTLVFGALALAISYAAWRAVHSEHEARQLALQLREATVATYVGEALRRVDEDDASSALAYLAGALRIDGTRDSARALLLDLLQRRAWPAPLYTLEGLGNVAAAALSPDGRSVVVAAQDSARVWDLRSGRPLTPPIRGVSPMTFVAYSPDGARLATTSLDGSVRVWDAVTGQPSCPAIPHAAPPVSITFSPNGELLATTTRQGAVRVWGARSGLPLGPSLEHRNPISRVILSNDEHRVWTVMDVMPQGSVPPASLGVDDRRPLSGDYQRVPGSNDERVWLLQRRVVLWDFVSGRRMPTPWSRSDLGLPIVASNHEGTLVVGPASDGMSHADARRTAQVWDLRTGRPLTAFQHPGQVTAAEFSPDGRRVVTRSSDLGIRIWNVADGRVRLLPQRQRESARSMTFGAGGTHVVIISDNWAIRAWDALAGKPTTEPWQRASKQRVLQVGWRATGLYVMTVDATVARGALEVSAAHPPRALVLHRSHASGSVWFHPSGRCILTVSGSDVWILDVGAGRPARAVMRHQATVTDFAFSLDGKAVVTTSFDGSARLWEACTGRPLSQPLQHGAAVMSVGFGPGGQFATASFDKSVRLWDVHDLTAPRATLRHSEKVWSVAFDPRGTMVAAGLDDGTVHLWSLGGAPRDTGILTHDVQVLTMRFNANGSRLITAGGGHARVWDVTARRPIGPRLRGPGGIRDARLSADGRLALTYSSDDAARMWDVTNGSEMIPALKHGGQVTDAVFSADGRMIATASRDGSARLWDARTGAPVSTPLVHDGEVTAVAFSPDGTRLATMSQDGSTVLWDVLRSQPIDAEFLADFAETVSGRRISSKGALEDVTDRANRIKRLREGSGSAPLGEPTALSFARWFFADPWERSISPLSAITVPEYIQQRLDTGDPAERADVERDFAGHPLLRRHKASEPAHASPDARR